MRFDTPSDVETIHALDREWLWPVADKKCRKVIFDYVVDLQEVIKRCRGRRTAVQAGGNMGVWPWILADEFEQVYTFEPDLRCYELLKRNLEGCSNIKHQHAALMDIICYVKIANDKPNNLGAQYVVPHRTGVPAITIDSLRLESCDLLYLDIEGAELPALLGAENTLDKFHPVVVVEDKGLSSRFGVDMGDAEKWLQKFGYRVVDRPHRDVVLVCE